MILVVVITIITLYNVIVIRKTKRVTFRRDDFVNESIFIIITIIKPLPGVYDIVLGRRDVLV